MSAGAERMKDRRHGCGPREPRELRRRQICGNKPILQDFLANRDGLLLGGPGVDHIAGALKVVDESLLLGEPRRDPGRDGPDPLVPDQRSAAARPPGGSAISSVAGAGGPMIRSLTL